MRVYDHIFDLDYTRTETSVLCPFKHTTGSGLEYSETRASAHVNHEKGLFHCKACGVGYNEQQFIQKFFECTYKESMELKQAFREAENAFDWKELTLSDTTRQYAKELGISDAVIDQLELKTENPENQHVINFPVIVENALLDIRKYAPTEPHGKRLKSRGGALSGLIIPYNLWREAIDSNPKQLTLICAGEKDMAIARSHGFTAITITGGEQTLPKLKSGFKDHKVAIVYDNDDTGREGARKLAACLLEVGAEWVKIVEGFHEVCREKGEDITDFFMKYGKTKEDLITYIENTPKVALEELEKKTECPIVTLLEASKPPHVGNLVKSNVQVVVTENAAYTIPSHFIFRKLREANTCKGNSLSKDDVKEWKLDEKNIHKLLYLCDSGLKEEQIKKNMRALAGVPPDELYISTRVEETVTVFKVVLTDMFETQVINAQPMEYTAYSLNHKLSSGQKYKVTHKLVPHPYRGNQLTMVILDVEQANDSVTNFKVDAQTIEHLKTFQQVEGDTQKKINTIVERAKGLIQYNGISLLIATIDLAFHTPLYFNFGAYKNIRAYLDTFIVGESRAGKSSTAETLRKTYGLGVFTSLAGNSATIPGLVGGSNQTAHGYQTRAGVIPQNNGGLIIFEEFGKSNANISAELTDIRSSNEVRIARVSGSITLPAYVRMITISNVKNEKGLIKPIASYPNGISILTELVPTAEDIARYDIMLVLPDTGNKIIDPLWEPEEPFSQEEYQTRIRWVWSRTAEQIIIEREVQRYIGDQANALNAEYECHIKIFGTEAWKKLARLTIALAGYLVSTDKTYENIVVTKEHVDYAVQLFKRIYDNRTFRLREYVTQERKHKEIDENGIGQLKDLYLASPALINYLEQEAVSNKSTLEAVTGLDSRELNVILKRMIKELFIRFDNNLISPTERFRKGMTKIDKSALKVEKVQQKEA